MMISSIVIANLFHVHVAAILPSWLLHPLGYCVGSPKMVVACKGYNFWSGIISDLGEVTLIGGSLAMLKHLNCDAPRCLRYGPHRTADGHHKLCRKHHPDLPNHKLSLKEIHLRHHATVQDRRGTGSTAEDDSEPHGGERLEPS